MRNWQRNLAATAALVALVPASLLASSYRYFEVYQAARPTQQIPVKDGVAHYTSRLFIGSKPYQRDVSIRFLDATKATSWNGLEAAPSGQMWVFSFELAARPEVYLEGCSVRVLDSEGKIYRPLSATLAMPGAEVNYQPCLPPEAPGPVMEFDADKLTQPTIPRPPTWEITQGVVLPEGVEPAQVDIMWDPPQYARFAVK